jgi:hypothetical protein
MIPGLQNYGTEFLFALPLNTDMEKDPERLKIRFIN